MPWPFSRRHLATAFLALTASVLLPIAHAAQRPANLLFWKVQANEQTAYVLGSLHVGRSSFYPLAKPIEKAYQAADTLAVEADITRPDAASVMLPFVTYTAPDNLTQHIQPATWQRLSELASAMKQSPDAIKSVKPAFLSLGMLMGAFAANGLKADLGIDLHFLRRAKQDGKALVELESLEAQARLLNDMSDADGDQMLNQTLDGLKDGSVIKEVKQLAASWEAGDAAAMSTVLDQANHRTPLAQRMAVRLFDERNAGMAERIAELLNSGKRAFVVVGAGHLVGKGNVLELLQARGFKVTQLSRP